MLEGSSVEVTPSELIRQVESWAVLYPEERRSLSGALHDAARRIAGEVPVIDPVTWSAVGEPDPRTWLVEDWLPAGTVALLTGEGGAGKSRLALQLAAAVASDRSEPDKWIQGSAAPRLGAAVPDGGVPVVYATWEDRADEMVRRLSQISGPATPWCNPISLDNLKLLDLAGHGPLWFSSGRYEMPALAPLGYGVRRVAEDVGAGLLVLDSLAAVYCANENDRGQVRGFMASWDAWAASAGCAVLIIGHPPKSAAGYSGSTDWNSAARARWELVKRPRQPVARGTRSEDLHWQLAVVKSNYGPEPQPVCLDWDPTGPRWEVSGVWGGATSDYDGDLLVSVNGDRRDARYDDI